MPTSTMEQQRKYLMKNQQNDKRIKCLSSQFNNDQQRMHAPLIHKYYQKKKKKKTILVEGIKKII
jgi:hypothetical protein